RAIGSRWWQIPKERVVDFVEALKRDEDSEYVNALKRDEDDEWVTEMNMVSRALGLLNRDYKDHMFARSANKRWVIYERRGLPCLIDTHTETEELLGWSPNDKAWLNPAWANSAL